MLQGYGPDGNWASGVGHTGVLYPGERIHEVVMASPDTRVWEYYVGFGMVYETVPEYGADGQIVGERKLRRTDLHLLRKQIRAGLGLDTGL